ncbi:hypothetical protein OG455_17240 [Kitasatospora sp. NBC_01287]|uniref:hypothetical protein n=1 Tax=Kitasatospora sp. NBC_01287 TaxID=2903573 RepID=UPI00224C9CFA|nr:hypothetical protein [Kitasatospora sp. NBC_01287]MCX4747244.1 hypothetical protein [Kitasatospora sp. NBC_01287]
MTDNQIASPPPPFIERGLPECQCPANCGGRPEAMLRIPPTYPTVRDDGRTKPPEQPYTPTRRGELVFDVLNQRHGAFMARTRQTVYLRPERGGTEWEVDAQWLVKLP